LVDRIVESEGIITPIREMSALGDAARAADPNLAVDVLTGMVERHSFDPLVAYLALCALAPVRSGRVDELLVGLLDSPDPALSQYAAWALSRRRPVPGSLPALEAMVERDGFSRMMAELTLENWLRELPELIWRMRSSHLAPLAELTEKPRPMPRPGRHGPGLRIAQVLIQGMVDAGISAAGSGDGGGLITLQVGLTRELAKHDEVDEVYLVTRLIRDGTDRFSEPHQAIGEGTLARIEFGDPGYLPTGQMWGSRAELERRLREFLVGHGPFDALHLRFADVGTFVAARLGEELGIPVFFTLAPDPHAVIAAREQAGLLRRDDFGAVEAREHYLFRAWLVEWMLDRADRIALLPRQDHHQQFRDLFGVDVSQPEHFRVIPEGVDLQVSDEARQVIADLETSSEWPAVIVDLERAISQMPPTRHRLPILLTVGRLHPIKGMDRVVAAWARDPKLRSEYNLVVVGGNISSPSPDEQATLAAMSTALGGMGDDGLVLLGNRSHREVSLVLAAAAAGTPAGVAPNGVYVSGSEKEEFGLAIVEALAAGLPVIAPSAGGPATYVEHGFTGYLTDTRRVEGIRAGIRWADGTRGSEMRTNAARRLIRSDYSLNAMASNLVSLYQSARAETTAS
jgi:glycosyltransferase involved in cell wall biosynthesis